MSKENDLPLNAMVAAALEASLQEKYEVLDKIGQSMPEDERALFFELVEILKPVYPTK